VLHALLIDDEASARADLRTKLAAHGDITVVGEAATLRDSRILLANTDYDLVFFDVQLIGGDSFQLVPLVRPGASIVFATAHDRYALRAFDSRAADYLLKPIAPARLAEAILRARIVRATGGQPGRAAPGPNGEVEVDLSADERIFLRKMAESWEDALRPTHVLRVQSDATRIIRYKKCTEPTRVFLSGAADNSVRRCWRAVRALLPI